VINRKKKRRNMIIPLQETVNGNNCIITLIYKTNKNKASNKTTGKLMNNTGNLRISSVVLLISTILISVAAFSVLSDNSNTSASSEEEIEQMLNEALDPITKNVQIIDKVGKYYGEPQQQKIEKIGILIKPLISDEIDLSELTIKISDGNSLRILSYSNQVALFGNNNLFDHPIWDSLTTNNFGLIVTRDIDNSLVDYDTINKNTDMVYIVIKLPSDYHMKKGDSIIVQLFPSSGLTKTTMLDAPLPMTSVVSL